MEKRLVIFLALSVLIIFLYPFFVTWMIGPPIQNQPVPGTVPEEKEAFSEQESIRLQETPITNIEEEKSDPTTPEESDQEVITTMKEKIKVIESDLYRISISNVGGTIKDWELKHYTEKDESGNPQRVTLASEEAAVRPLSLFMEDSANNEKRIYSLNENTLRLNPGNPEVSVKMGYTGLKGEIIEKEFRFYHDEYRVDISIHTEGYNEGYSLSLGTNFGIHDWGADRGRSAGAISLINGDVVRDTPSKMEEDVTYEGETRWAALHDKYFLSALIPKDVNQVGPVTIEGQGDSAITSSIRIVPEKGSRTTQFSLYAGPKEYDRLRKMRVNLDETIDFGWFISGSWLPVRLIAKPIFYLLRFFFQFTGNYGVAIILVTVLVKAILFPVTWKSLRSMKAMGDVQPKVAAIKKKWAKDKERLNKELINLYKVEKINPLGGCLPIFIQIPVFISLFNILYTTIDLRQAHFMLWVTDLAEKDPYYVLPIIMGASMILQQYTQPTTMEASQAKVMKFLPIVYTFFFLNFPSGLVLYWLVNNILTIGQQYLMKRENVAV